MTAATEDVYFANMGIITVAGASGTPASATIAVAKNVEAQPYGTKVYGFLTEKMNAFVQENPQYRKKTTVRKNVVNCTEEEPA